MTRTLVRIFDPFRVEPTFYMVPVALPPAIEFVAFGDRAQTTRLGAISPCLPCYLCSARFREAMGMSRRDFGRAAVFSAGGLAARQAASTSPNELKTALLRGRILCLTEEYKRLYQVAADCANRGHVYALRTNDNKTYPILPTDSAAAIILDEKTRARELQITARLFPESSFAEVVRLQSLRNGRVYNLFYFCEVCNIRTHKPGPCDCCQDPVEFREIAADEDEQSK